MVSADLPGKDQLVEQSKELEVTRECECGCGTVDYTVKESASVANARDPVSMEAYGDGIGVLLFVRNGFLQPMDIVDHDDPITGWFPKQEKLNLWVPGGPA